MPTSIGIALLFALNAWIAWRFSRQDIGPDEGLWLLPATTKAIPFTDFPDCKPPGIYIWTWLLGKVTGGSIPGVKFLHHLSVGGAAVAIYLMTGSLGAGLIFTALAQSAHLLAFQSWTDAACAAPLAIACLTDNEWLGVGMLGLAVAFNVKIAPPGLVLIALRGWWLPFGGGCGLAAVVAGVLLLAAPQFARDVWYSSITIPARMQKWRKEMKSPLLILQSPAILLVVPALALAMWSAPRLDLWLPAVIYIALNTWGGVWRANHWLPLSGLVAASTPPTLFAGAILAAEWLGAGFYLGNVWERHYPGIAPLLAESRKVGEVVRELLAGKPGRLWVNSFDTEIYAYSGSGPEYALTQQLEIEPVAQERRSEREKRLAKNPPDIIVIGPGNIQGRHSGYKLIASTPNFGVWG